MGKALLDGPAADSHGIDLGQEEGIRAQLLHVPGYLHQGRYVPETPEDAPGIEGIPHALVHTVFQGNLDIRLESVHTTDHDHGYDEIRPGQGLPPIGGGGESAGQLVLLLHVVHYLLDYLQPAGVDVHQHDVRVLQGLMIKDILDQPLAELYAAGSDHGYPGHGHLLSACGPVFLYYKILHRGHAVMKSLLDKNTGICLPI